MSVMSDMREKLRELGAKWRENSCDSMKYPLTARATFQYCAYELDAILADEPNTSKMLNIIASHDAEVEREVWLEAAEAAIWLEVDESLENDREMALRFTLANAFRAKAGEEQVKLSKELEDMLEKISKEVESWPAWRRSIDLYGCKRCGGTGWVPALEPAGPFLREIKGIKERCTCQETTKGNRAK